MCSFWLIGANTEEQQAICLIFRTLLPVPWSSRRDGNFEFEFKFSNDEMVYGRGEQAHNGEHEVGWMIL